MGNLKNSSDICYNGNSVRVHRACNVKLGYHSHYNDRLCRVIDYRCNTHRLWPKRAATEIELMATDIHNSDRFRERYTFGPADELEIRGNLARTYEDVYTPDALGALAVLCHYDADRRALMSARIQRRAARARDQQRIAFLDPDTIIPRSKITVQQAREGNFVGSDIPRDLQRQWIQGTGPGARPHVPIETSMRNVAYALLSGADGWMFDGEDALGQITSMSLDNQRNLKLAIDHNPIFMDTAQRVSAEMNQWANTFFGHPIIDDWQQQIDFTTKIFRARGLHLDDRHVRFTDGGGLSASIVDLVLYVVNNYKSLQSAGASVVLYLPKIQTA